MRSTAPSSGGSSSRPAYSRFPRETLAELLAGMGAAIDAHGGGFTMNYTTLLRTAVRAG